VPPHGAYLVARFAGCDDPDKAGAYRGAEVALRREDLPKPAEHEFYQADLIGLEVVNREGVRLGRCGFSTGGARGDARRSRGRTAAPAGRG